MFGSVNYLDCMHQINKWMTELRKDLSFLVEPLFTQVKKI